MADKEASTPLSGDDVRSPPMISGDGDGDLSGVCEILRDIPSQVVKDLLSIGVCQGCILRLLGVRRDFFPSSTLPSSVLSSVFEDIIDPENQRINPGGEESGNCSNCATSKGPETFCSICFGILQFAYCDQKGVSVLKNSAYDFAASISELVKQDSHQVDGFSLEVSIPQIIQENELSICLYLKKKYGSEPWLQKRLVSECVSLKDALKTSIAKPLEKMLDCKSSSSTFRIRLTYTHPKASSVVQDSERNHGCKRRKTGTGNGLENHDGSVQSTEFLLREASVVVESSLETHQDGHSSDRLKFPPEKVTEPCKLVFQCNRSQIYFGGRYLKFSRNVSQTRWIIDDERMGDASVEELIGSKILPVCRGDNYKFHAAGREDIDVRMLGSGRPFLVEVQNPRRVPTEGDVKDIEKRINDSENKLVGVKYLKIVGSQGWTLMREGEAEKQKQYAALVWISRPLKDEDFQSICSYKEMQVLQKTPIRVLHRRSPLEREKIIHWMRIEKIAGSSQYFLLHLCTQAGTYIKEFVHGDLGRTHPSIGSLLDCRAEILQLDVTDVKMDCFLDEQGIL